MENVWWDFLEMGVLGSIIEMAVARPITKRRARNLDSFKYGLEKAKHLDLAD